MLKKISVIGAGNVGATCAQRIVEKGYADVVLLDIVEGLPQGKALDIAESAPVLNFNSRITGTNDYKDTADSNIVIITSGLGRKPGMTRDELLSINMKIVGEVTKNVVKYSPDCVLIVVTNPVDVMTSLAIKLSGFSTKRVIGLSGVLDTARLRSFIAAELNASVSDTFGCILGEHGKNMIVIPRLCTVSGIPITSLLPTEAIDRLVQRAINGGGEIVELLKTGSAFYAPSAAITEMAEAIIFDKNQVLPCTAYLQGEYGISEAAIDVPVKLGKDGIVQIVELELTEEEKSRVTASGEAVKQLIGAMKLE